MKEKMSAFLSKKSTIIIIVVLLISLGLGSWIWWSVENTAYFRDVTIELGEKLPDISAFIKEDASPLNPRMVTSEQDIDLSKTGEQILEFTSVTGSQKVKLIIEDSTAPEVVFQDVFANWNDELKPEAFIQEISDLSSTTVEFAETPARSETSNEAKVKLVVTDANGNRTEGTCTVSFTWMYQELALELGQELTKEALLINPEQDSPLLDQAELDKIDTFVEGTHTIISTKDDRSCQCVVTVKDTVAPELILKNVTMDSNQKLKIDQFIEKVGDVSGDITVAYEQEPDSQKEGTQNVTIIATDANGNTTTATATLKVLHDSTAPVFSGMSAISVKKGATPDYETGVKAEDSRDGSVKFTYDANRVDTSKPGTYYVTYTATDSSGNKATYRRQVTVAHGPEDTAALIKEAAATLSNDPVAINKWVRDTIQYSSNWGGNDPIWYGMKNKKGNCYVHAMILDALLKEKGYETQLIWVTEMENGRPTHYWNLVKVNGVWRHIDATTGVKHPESLMTDQVRYNNLQGRDWDRSKWPKCE